MSPKANLLKKRLTVQTSITAIDPQIRHGDVPQTPMEEWAVGSAYSFVHQSANKNMTNVAAVEQYKTGHRSGVDLRIATV